MTALVTAIVVTRGDHPLDDILESIPKEWDSAVWDNGARTLTRYGAHRSYWAEWSGNEHYGPLRDLSVYGRYEAIDHVDGNAIFVQDDDCLLAPEAFDALVAAYKPGHVVCNMPERFRDTGFYDDHALVGFGAIFDRDLPEQAFADFFWGDRDSRLSILSDPFSDFRRGDIAGWEPIDSVLFNRACDIVFTTLTPRILVELPYADLPWATDDTRMYRQKDHVGERTRMLDLARKVRDA